MAGVGRTRPASPIAEPTPDPSDPRLLEHNYDGVQEYDNPLPRWWVAIFYATIVFSIPVGLVLLDKKDHPYMALGVLSGMLSIPILLKITWPGTEICPCSGPLVMPE